MAIIDSYSESNHGIDSLFSSTRLQIGQSFTGDGNDIGIARFYCKWVNASVTGTCVAHIYAHTGTYGGGGYPVGSALATSDTFDASNLTSSYALIELTFSTQYTTTNGTNYCVALDVTNVSTPGNVRSGSDSSSPTHSGNYVFNNSGTWGGSSGVDNIFYVETADAAGTNTQINIADSWKTVDAMKINISDSWKDVVAVKQNIGDVWKDVF